MQSREERRAVLHQVRAGRLTFPASVKSSPGSATASHESSSAVDEDVETTEEGGGPSEATGAGSGIEAHANGVEKDSTAADQGNKKNTNNKKRHFAVPENIDQLKDFARRKKLKLVDPEYLRQVLYAEGVPLDKRGDHLSHGQLAREVHKLLYGVYPVSVAPIVSGYQRRPRPHFGSERKRRQ